VCYVLELDTLEEWISSTGLVAKLALVVSHLHQMQTVTDASDFVSLLWRLLT